MESINYLTMVDKPDARWHRSPIIVWRLGRQFIIAEFKQMEQLDFFAQTLGFTYELVEEKESPVFGTMKTYKVSHYIEGRCDGGFWKLSDLPADAKPIKALSNGNIVTCYFTNDGKKIKFYRPNPNAKEIYHPLPLEDSIAHHRIYGVY